MRSARDPLPQGFGSLWLTVVLDLIGFGIGLPLLPLFAKNELHASAWMVGVVVAAYSVGQFVGAPVLGRLSDRYGRRPVLILSLFGSAVGHLFTGLAGSVAVIIAARLFDGFSGGSLSISHAAAADLAPPPQRPRLFGLLGAGIALGFVAGPALGALAAVGGHRTPFFLAAALCGINALTAWWRLPAFPVRRRDEVAAVVEAAGVTEADVAEPAGERAGLSWGGLRLLTPGSALGRSLLALLMVGSAFAGFEATFVLLGERRVGIDEQSAGLVFAAVGLLLSVVQVGLVKRCIGQWGAARTARLAAVVSLVGYVALVPAAGWFGLVPAVAMLTVSQGLMNPAMSTLVSMAAPPQRRGQAFGVQQSVGAAGRILGPLVALALFGVGVSLPYVVGAALAITGLVVLSSARVDEPAALASAR